MPELTSGFYTNALTEINAKLKSDPSNVNLIEQKLYYCDQLDWPTTCISALNEYKAKFGMTNQLIEQYLEYYQINQRHQLIVEVIERWNDEFDLIDQYQLPFIESLVLTGKKERAKRELRAYLISNDNESALSFASLQYLMMQDTTMAIYNLSKLNKLNSLHPLMLDYGDLLISKNRFVKGFNAIENCSETFKGDEQANLRIARIYERQNWLKDARNKIKPFIASDTMAYMVADWYRRELLWDSSIMYIDSVIVRDSLNLKAWWKRARAYEDRGWLSYSLRYFDKMIEIDSTDSLAIKRKQLIQQKIAYLQRKKFEESKVPILDIQPRKINN